MSKSQIFLFFCVSFIGGVFLNSFFIVPQLLALCFVILGVFLISVLWERRKFVVIGFCFLFLAVGVWRHQEVILKIYYPQEKIVSFSGKVVGEPDIRKDNARLTVEAKEISGKILLVTDRYPEYQYGDELMVSGKIQIPQEFEASEEDKSSSSSLAGAQDFNYKDYLAKDGIYSIIYYPQLELAGRGNYSSLGSAIYAVILSFKNELRGSINQNLSPPQSSIISAIILGDKRQISQEWKDKLNYAGLRHLTAISGMHVAVLTAILMSFLIGLGFWRRHAFYLSITLIALFILLTGLQPSAVRAGIMGGLFLLAQHVGRKGQSLGMIVLAAALMLFHNPLLLKLDVGFQLSFLAMLGIIYFSPIFQNWLRRVPSFFHLKDVLAMTLSAQVFTLPILIYNFGYFSVVSPLTNILIVPFLPFIMGLGLMFALLGTVYGFFGQVLSLPLWLLLTYLLKITEWFSSFSFSALVFEISWVWLVIFYLVVAVFVWRFNEKEKLKFLKY